mgnify:CR=1 FL=1
MDAFDSGSELSSADEEVIQSEPETKRGRSASMSKAISNDAATSERRAKRPRSSLPHEESHRQSGTTSGSANPNADPNSVASETSIEVQRAKPRTASRTAQDASFAHNMSGWDQLFGPMASAATEPARPKDATPEQRAAAVEAEAAKMRETRAREAREKAKEAHERAKEAHEKAKEQERQVATAMREARARNAHNGNNNSSIGTGNGSSSISPLERRPQSVTADALAEKRRQLRREMHDTHSLDLLEHGRLMHAFEEEMAHDRRTLRASKLGAGLQHLKT